LAARNRRAAGFHQHRNFAGRIEAQKAFAAFPGFFNLEIELKLLFPKHNPHLAGMGGQPIVVKRAHANLIHQVLRKGT